MNPVITCFSCNCSFQTGWDCTLCSWILVGRRLDVRADLVPDGPRERVPPLLLPAQVAVV